MINFSEVRKKITKDQMIEILCGWGIGCFEDRGNYVIFPTVCHNTLDCQDSMKLYYYENTGMFRCYTECDSLFDVFELGVKMSKIDGKERTLFDVVDEIVRKINYDTDGFISAPKYDSPLQPLLKSETLIPYPEYDAKVLNYFKHDMIPVWGGEGISKEAMDKFEIAYYPVQNKIVIPHRDIGDKLIGIRGRALNAEDIAYAKYMPLILNNIKYSHPLSFNLYGLNKTKKTIQEAKKALVFEGEKSVLLCETYYGEDNIAVASCGSSLNKFQVFLLIKFCDVSEIILCYDRQFETAEEEEKYFNKLTHLCEKYNSYCKMSFIFDDKKITKFKDSPIDRGTKIFEKLLSERTEVTKQQ